MKLSIQLNSSNSWSLCVNLTSSPRLAKTTCWENSQPKMTKWKTSRYDFSVSLEYTLFQFHWKYQMSIHECGEMSRKLLFLEEISCAFWFTIGSHLSELKTYWWTFVHVYVFFWNSSFLSLPHSFTDIYYTFFSWKRSMIMSITYFKSSLYYTQYFFNFVFFMTHHFSSFILIFRHLSTCLRTPMKLPTT